MKVTTNKKYSTAYATELKSTGNYRRICVYSPEGKETTISLSADEYMLMMKVVRTDRLLNTLFRGLSLTPRAKQLHSTGEKKTWAATLKRMAIDKMGNAWARQAASA